MSQYNKLSNFQYARFPILAVHLYFECFGQLVSPLWEWEHSQLEGNISYFANLTVSIEYSYMHVYSKVCLANQ